ncbi:General transcription factor II-I repeat domain-containing protein 2A [Xyrichtys novacula]|uniref:General transcription factor II-I repeat domain-containing protein 2A n=1 Tax=Xyrichtys novacula TaxID=13765 RepID=A0AAV1G862_XYRNO|nr:General transcription factor II-I repeat domain-containing protein 2A [Xyrichtys novacula]
MTQLKNGMLAHFPNLEKMVQGLEDDEVFQPKRYCAHLDKLSTKFSRRFGELDDMGEICAFVSHPFAPIDIEQVAAKMLKVFNLPNDSEIDMEIVEMQNDIELSARARDSNFWGLVSRERFPLLSGCALRLSAYFGSTYLCEMTYSQMKKSDDHLTDCLRLAVSSYEPNFKSLTNSIQSQPSH